MKNCPPWWQNSVSDFRKRFPVDETETLAYTKRKFKYCELYNRFADPHGVKVTLHDTDKSEHYATVEFASEQQFVEFLLRYS